MTSIRLTPKLIIQLTISIIIIVILYHIFPIIKLADRIIPPKLKVIELTDPSTNPTLKDVKLTDPASTPPKATVVKLTDPPSTPPKVTVVKLTDPPTPKKVTFVQPPRDQLPPVCGDPSDFIDPDTTVLPNRPNVDLFINIPAAGHLYIRRKTLREGWLSTVKHYSVAYRFFTDEIAIKPEIRKNVTEEQEKYKDIEFIPTRNGYWLTHRYLFAMFWAYKHYNFSFYMKVDDDYFVCLNNLQNDLQYRKHEKLLYWGHFGCDPKMVAMDEGFLIITTDLVREIMKRNNSLCCSPFGGQMIAMWINLLEKEGHDVTYFPDNPRLMHYRSYLKKEHSNMCKEILGIHQAYPEHMARYWSITKDNWYSIKSDEFLKVKRKKYSDYCSRPKVWDWRVLNPFWRHQPKPCWEPGLRWPELEKYKEVQSRERDEKNK